LIVKGLCLDISDCFWLFYASKYNKGNIGSYIIFRDSLFNNNYYCTDEFVDFVKQYSITGLKFTCAGIAK